MDLKEKMMARSGRGIGEAYFERVYRTRLAAIILCTDSLTNA
jgi:hypothetical protein